MANPLFPFKRYLPPSGFAAVAGIARVSQDYLPPQYGALMSEYLLWGALFSFGWIFGLIYADLNNATSQLRRWWRYRTRLFDVVSIKRYPRDDAQGRHEQITLCIRFVRRVRDASIHMRVEVPGWSLPKSLDLLTNVSKAKDAELTIVIAVAHVMKQPVVNSLIQIAVH